jgi:hypothetical protein
VYVFLNKNKKILKGMVTFPEGAVYKGT